MMNTNKPPVTFAAMLVRAQRRFEAVGAATALMAFPGAQLQLQRSRVRQTPERQAAAPK
jgi:hypothetical protein